MHFKKESLDSQRSAGPREIWNEVRIASRSVPLAPRRLNAVRHVEHNRLPERTHDYERTEVDDEIVVAEGSPSLGQKDLAVSVALAFSRPCASPAEKETALSSGSRSVRSQPPPAPDRSGGRGTPESESHRARLRRRLPGSSHGHRSGPAAR